MNTIIKMIKTVFFLEKVKYEMGVSIINIISIIT